MTQDIYELSSSIVDGIAAASPTLATTVGIPGFDHLWDDFSLDGRERYATSLRGWLDDVRSCAPEDEWARLAQRVAEDHLERQLGFFDAGEHLLDLNSIASPAQELRDIFDEMDTTTRQGWDDIVARLEGLPAAASGYAALLEAARRSGSTVARRQVLESVRQLRNHAGSDSHFETYPGAARDSGVVDDAAVDKIVSAVAVARRGLGELADYLESEYLPDAGTEDAVGPDRYRYLASRFLGSDLDPPEAYEWGWEEVGRLRARMAEVAESIAPGEGLSGALEVLLTDPDRAAGSQDEFRDLMLARLEQALGELEGSHFDVPAPIREIDVKMTPPGGSLGAYYVQPSEDYSRPGTVYWSKGDQQQIPLFDEVTTAYHEGFPGHHLQVGLQMTAGDRFSRLQRLMVWYAGSGEGWALYSEDLMEELGYLERPDYVMGKLAAEMLRACRVVIDIGSHLRLPIPSNQPFHPGEDWSFDRGVEMLVDYSALEPDMAVSEMNRYLGWPGQAISYKLGQRAIRDLRAAEMSRRGNDFDQKSFHGRLLEVGAVGLDLLEEHIGSA